MNAFPADQILQTLEDLCRLEAAMAAYYLACSERWQENSPFWMELALEEERHEKIIRDLGKVIGEYPDQFGLGIVAEPSAISSFVDNIREKTADILKGIVTLAEALAFALGIEGSIIEGRFFEVIVSGNRRYLRFMQAMSLDLDRHRQRIREEMAKVGDL